MKNNGGYAFMKSETEILDKIKTLKERNEEHIGLWERSNNLAKIGSLEWVLNE